jgi:hypothetical protein
MPAWVSGAAAFGMKWVSCFPGNLARGAHPLGLVGCGPLGTSSLRMLGAAMPSAASPW